MSLENSRGLLTGCCRDVCYVNEKGATFQFIGANIYSLDASGNPVLEGVIVEDENGVPVDVSGMEPTSCTVERDVCGYRMPDGMWWLEDSDSEFNATTCNNQYRFTSFIVNGTEKIPSPSVGFVLNDTNINFVTNGSNQTYSNMIDFLNTWAAANCPDFEFVIPSFTDDASYGVFGIMAPVGATWTIRLEKSMCGFGSQVYEWSNGGVTEWDGNEQDSYSGFKCAPEQVWYDEGLI